MFPHMFALVAICLNSEITRMGKTIKKTLGYVSEGISAIITEEHKERIHGNYLKDSDGFAHPEVYHRSSG